MPSDLSTIDGIRAHLAARSEAYASQSSDIANSTGIGECYFEGYQQIFSSDVGWRNTVTGRILTNLNPDSNKLRVTKNELTFRIQKAIVATNPADIRVTVDPPLRDQGIQAEFQSQVLEDATAAVIKKCGFENAAVRANARRAVCGDYGILMRMQVTPRRLRGYDQPFADRQIHFCAFHPLRLILDPAIDARDLRDHYEVIYRDVWTIHDLRHYFPGEEFDESKMRTVGDLTPYEQQVSALSGGRLFGRYKTYATTKGARVYQIHRKDERGRFGLMWSVIEVGQQDMRCPNMEDPTSPFGGDGLPMVMIRGHQRHVATQSISDVSMVKDPQDLLNLMWTYVIRSAQKNTGPGQWLVDRASMGRMVQNEDFHHRFTNRVSGVIEWNSQNNRFANKPEIVQTPPLQQWIENIIDRASDAVLKQSHRSPQDFGDPGKTHITADAMRAAKRGSDQLLGIRADEDCKAYGQILNVALGTIIGNVQAESPSTVRMLQEEGFAESDLALLLKIDPKYPTCGLKVQNVQYRSKDEKREDLLALASSPNPAVDASMLRRGLASIEFALMEDDAQLDREIKRAVSEVIDGAEWQPVFMGMHNEWVLADLRKARWDKRVRRDQAAIDRINRAIQIQMQAASQEMLMANPELAAKVQQAQQPAEAPAEEAEAPPETIGQLVEQMANAPA